MALEYTDRRVDYLLIGGGLAAATTAEEIRKQDAQGSIRSRIAIDASGKVKSTVGA